ncbi:MAG TPA: tetratricopeptide repeat protein [Arachnia sp.]|nr:tetratricopeptide repeat protein [Arachnia sp.]HMT87301.1 tetratricopeptide repeat protein [Arachnia sp.]
MTQASFSRPGAIDLAGLTSVAPAAQGASYVTTMTEADFPQIASQSTQVPVIVEFYSPRDPAGEAVSRALESSVNRADGRFLLARVDVDDQPRLAQGLGVQAVPTVIAILGGQVAPLFQGTKPADEIDALLDQVAQVAVANGITGRAHPVSVAAEPGVEEIVDPRFEKADEALAAGDYARAVAEFDELLKETPNDPEVIAGRAQAALLERSLAFVPAEVVARAAEAPDDLRAQLDAADLEVIQGEVAAAFDRLLALGARTDADGKEAIRVRLLALFEVVGRTEKVVLTARRRLASLLF